MKTIEPAYKPIKERSLLEAVQCDSLIQEIEERLIINKEPFLYKTEESINSYEFSHFLIIWPDIPCGKKFDLYFHLGDAKDIDFKIDRKRKHKKLTLEDDMYKGVKLTLVYF